MEGESRGVEKRGRGGRGRGEGWEWGGKCREGGVEGEGREG